MHVTRREFTKRASLITLGSLAGLGLANANSTYTVRDGDTLGHIAMRHGISTTELRKLNKLSGDLIRVGQKLAVPSQGSTSTTPQGTSSTYTVKAGDTLGNIALIHGISVNDLKRANNLTGDMIRIGQKLKVPAALAIEDLLGHVRSATTKIKIRTSNWKRIVVHHSAIKYGNAAIYDRAHRKRGMKNGLAYHFVIGNGIDSGDGEIEIGPRWTKQLLGGHVKSYGINLTAIGICLVGNFEATHPTQRQLAAFTQLMDWLRGEIIPNAKQFAGHRDLRGEQTICPGKNFPLAAMHARYD
ncbi:LysM peptidoglycan-binding domain-containing protein [Coraliomargarita sp. SDUM461004]|uniref:LysM peptidoglycan-binding domain-containing protein n=1 Tax=Thalassobacterium sedimentorum TaxID=3041258 RepID=A0ABU1ANC0_9BACT|nr:LysM peptidoglycan-binding domain-containing protein [Coraliomargarita sp. SDUM461004]MDQ8196287.1 LysM peptidoglycan-binding domain-containing protein [Coraliomargarita sp. SDUM461004]